MLVLEAEAISVGSVRSRFHAARLRLDAKRGSRSGGGPTNIRGTNRRALAAAQQRRPTTRGSCLSVWLVVNPMAGDVPRAARRAVGRRTAGACWSTREAALTYADRLTAYHPD